MIPKIRLTLKSATLIPPEPSPESPILHNANHDTSDEKSKPKKRKKATLTEPRKKRPNDDGPPKAPPMIKKKSLYTVLTKLVAVLKAKDTWGFFITPVDTSRVPDYLNVVKYPMDLGKLSLNLVLKIDYYAGTMEKKVYNRQYANAEAFKVCLPFISI